ncbi:formyltetrahydrofolate deformylase [Kordiimonas sp. SCSIO 12610]|nr:formyltetrahydrofolate deformylase [Kordiimonas sp. SCSIO 12610]UTW56580.1 formyltetrahydrofolate deformylase [Kordiimonas sp. SCSIO 12610]
MSSSFVLTFSCPDREGIVADISSLLAKNGCNITSSDQFADTSSHCFFMRLAFTNKDGLDCNAMRALLAPTVSEYSDNWSISDADKPQRVLIMVSKFDHCLMDLLYRNARGAINMDIRAVVSNHRDAYQLAASYDVPFHHMPITPDTKKTQEDKLYNLVQEEEIDLIILARYMQIFSDTLCAKMDGRVINIHHSFLPSFKGAKPYHQAFEKGVKIIGATAHYVTPDLDEGPIIEQNIARVNHAMTPDDLVATGRDVERITLAEAVTLHLEHRVIRNGNKTVVFKR